MKLLDQLNDVIQEIFKYFGYESEWIVYPIEDNRKFYWEYENGRDLILYDTLDAYYIKDDKHMYVQEIINNKVFIKEDYTAMIIDTRTDGNKFFIILDNKRRVGMNVSNIPQISVAEHTWLDMSKGWFVEVNGKRIGGELNSLFCAEEEAKMFAIELNGN